MAKQVTLYRRDFLEVPEDDADFFGDFLFDLGLGVRGDYESVAHIEEVTVIVAEVVATA